MIFQISIAAIIGIYGVMLKWFIYGGCPYKSGTLLSINACQSEWNITIALISATAALGLYFATNKYFNKLMDRINKTQQKIPVRPAAC
jgi:hypothetical protein